MGTHDYFETLPDGRVRDTRYRFRRGDRVQITEGEYEGLSVTVDSRVFQDSVEHPGERAPGYHTRLGSGQVITVRWDQVESVNSWEDR